MCCLLVPFKAGRRAGSKHKHKNLELQRRRGRCSLCWVKIEDTRHNLFCRTFHLGNAYIEGVADLQLQLFNSIKRNEINEVALFLS